MENYSNIEDFIFDESFQQFVTLSNTESIDFWNTWLINHIDKKENFEKAVDICRILINSKKLTIPVDKNIELQALLQKIEFSERQSKRTVRISKSNWFKAAAVFILAIGLSALWNLFQNINAPANDIKYCEIIVPTGEKSQVILADGTNVWINSGSHFKYPVNFGSKSREVFLSGEAYFDVTKQKGKTFVVNTRDVRVNVIGTAFDVKCYPNETKTLTTVVRGLVRVENISNNEKVYLKPYQMATVKIKNDQKLENIEPVKDNTQVEVRKVNPENIICWKDHLLVFYDESLEEMALKMERWYNLKIVILDEKLKKERFNGKFVKNETISQVLEAIKLTTPIKYKILNNEIIITRAK